MAEHVEKIPHLARRTMFDGATVLGLAGGILLVVIAIGLGGSASAFFNIPGLLIVVGGTMAVTTVCFTMTDVARTVGVIGSTFMARERDPQDVAYTMLELSDFARKHGVLRLQGQPLQRFAKEPLLFKALSMLVEGLPEKDIADILNEDLAATTARVQRSANVLRKAAEISPAMGLIGTLIGLVQMLGNLSDPSVIGPAMAVALLTTFYGVVLANMVFNPLAAKLERNAAEEHLIGYIYTLGTLSIIRKDAPRRLEMLLNSALPPESKVRFAGERDDRD
ncbi:MAG: MotA/TolQ/ExbB proton channel family protein [Proteobacteria bacterium]|nr:MotA/TolQ/ExbB proton channel family protein [Pseudomonadota bacterium]